MIRSQHILLCLGIFFLLSTIPYPFHSDQVRAQIRPTSSQVQENRKDPFSLPKGVRLLSQEIPVAREEKKGEPILEIKTSETKPEEIPLKLKAILITDHARLASIERSIVTVGDFINGEKVSEIRPDRVILEKEGRKRTILLDPNPIKLKVEEKSSSKKE